MTSVHELGWFWTEIALLRERWDVLYHPPRISEAKLEGLVAQYGFDDGPAIEYFRVHASRDHEHAALARAAFEAAGAVDDPFRLLREVEAAYRAYWGMLDRLDEAEGA